MRGAGALTIAHVYICIYRLYIHIAQYTLAHTCMHQHAQMYITCLSVWECMCVDAPPILTLLQLYEAKSR